MFAKLRFFAISRISRKPADLVMIFPLNLQRNSFQKFLGILVSPQWGGYWYENIRTNSLLWLHPNFYLEFTDLDNFLK